jgi:hypothetical protein
LAVFNLKVLVTAFSPTGGPFKHDRGYVHLKVPCVLKFKKSLMSSLNFDLALRMQLVDLIHTAGVRGFLKDPIEDQLIMIFNIVVLTKAGLSMSLLLNFFWIS